ncbi:unnamed protein product [Lupinus luteus]|uniref:Serine aminopeptidase S33 domain-containing protein n=1 Tax=Lupinus luteus TaxID=3873 RepID=A0AAV1X743_LUPLU
MMKLPGIDIELQKILSANMDEVANRRSAREAFKDIQLGIDHILFKTPSDGLRIKESYEVNSKGLEIFCKSWIPEASKPKAALFHCHGIAKKLALSGYGVFAMDYPGFGLSQGLHSYIPSFDELVDNAAYNVIAYKDKPRLRTGLEMLKTTQEIERRLSEVSLPLLILHGEADKVTDPLVSKALYEKASCSDKTLKLYKDAYHCLLEGEPDEIIIQAFDDIISWLDEHSLKVET